MDFKSKKTILFDLDGTITDSGLGIINSFKYALNAYDIKGFDDDTLRKIVGPPLSESFITLLGFDEVKAKEAIEIYREYYHVTGIFENELYNGIEELLKALVKHGKKLILATSKAEPFAIKILEHFNVAQYFHGVAGSELNNTRIKKSEVITYAFAKYGIDDLESVVMIGDRMYDILGANEVGIESIGVLYGYGSYEELESAGASLIVDSIEELGRVLID